MFYSVLNRSALIGFLTLCTFNSPVTYALTEPCSIQPSLEASISKNLPAALKPLSAYSVKIIDLTHPELGCEASFQPNAKLYPASSIKTLIAFTILRKVDQGKLTLATPIKINQVNAAQECVDWNCNVYGPGKTRTIAQLMYDMIHISNNLATNQLIDVATRESIAEAVVSLGSPEMRVVRKMYNRVDPEPAIRERNFATTQAYVTLYEEIALGKKELLTEASRNLLISLLSEQHYHDGWDQLFPVKLKFNNKPGETSTSVSDAGFLYWNDHTLVILAALEGFGRGQGAIKFLQNIGLETFNFLKQTLGNPTQNQSPNGRNVHPDFLNPNE